MDPTTSGVVVVAIVAVVIVIGFLIYKGRSEARIKGLGVEMSFGGADAPDYEEVVEIGSDGKVYKPGMAPQSRASSPKPSILRDPKGEYRS